MKRFFSFSLAFILILVFSFSAFASVNRSADSWTLSFSGSSSIYTGNLWSTQNDYSSDVPVFSGTGFTEPPDGYILIGYASRGEDSRSRSLKYYIYAPVGTEKLCTYFPEQTDYIYIDSSFSSSNLLIIYNITTSSGTTGNSVYSGYKSSFSWNNYFKLVSFVPFADQQGNVITPPDYLSCELNVLTTTHFLYFNTAVSSDYSGDVKYYVFPSSVNLSTNSTLVYSGITSYFTEPDNAGSQSLISRGFKWYVDQQLQVLNFYGIVDTSNSTEYSLNYSSSFYSSNFIPSQISPVYSFLGSASPDKSLLLDLKSVSRTGVFAQDSLCLVAVVQNNTSFSYSRYDFNVSSILSSSGTIVNNTHISPTTPAPTPQVSDFQGLADYLKDLANLNDQNSTIRDQNFIAMLGAMPWSQYVGTGFSSQLPQLSMYLDSLFTDLFDNLTTPSQEDIESLYADIQAEKACIKAKLAFVSDVKTEMYFIISTITADNNSVPPNFQVTLPSVLFGGQSSVTVNILSYELATPYIVGIIKDIITVFLSLSLVVYVWKTLPSTIGNMPRGDD